MPYLSCHVWDLWSLLWHAGSLFIYLVVACKLLVVACWDLVPCPRIEPLPPCIGSAESCSLDRQGSTLFLECLLSTLFWLSPTYPSWPWFHYYFLRKAFWNLSLSELIPLPPLDSIVLLQVVRTYLFVCWISHSLFCINKLCVIR